MATKNEPGKKDCYLNAEPDEPIFTLLGRDRHAPTLVWLWATLRELDGEPAENVAEARECCFAMMKWASDHDRKVIGLGQAVLAGALELIRAANAGVKNATNEATGLEVLRRYLAETTFEDAPKDA